MTHKTNMINKLAVYVAILSSASVLFLLTLLHILSPEFDPSWRMVSEYANGDHGVVLSLLFICWAISSFSLAFALKNSVSSRTGKIGLGFLITSGIGEGMAAMFDINHSLHSVAAFIGIGSLPFAAVLISKNLSQVSSWARSNYNFLFTAHLTWVSLMLMAASFAVLMITFTQSGGDMTSQTPVTELPPGVIALVGWANRLLIVVYIAWILTVALQALRVSKQDN